MKFKFIYEHRNEFSILRMCRVLDVNRGSYYAWKKRPPCKRSIENIYLLSLIKDIHEESNKVYGSPKIWHRLKKQGIACSHKRVAKLMKTNNIRSIVVKKHKKKYGSVSEEEASMNILNREFNPEKPDKAWARTSVSATRTLLHLVDHLSRRISRSQMSTCILRSWGRFTSNVGTSHLEHGSRKCVSRMPDFA